MSARSHDRFEDDAAVYLLGGLPELEAQAFERHVMGCAICRDELERLRVAADALPRSVPALAAPPGLKGELMSRVEAEAEPEAKPARGRARERSPRAGLRQRLGQLALRPATAWVSAAFLLAIGIVAGGAIALTVGGEDDRSRTLTARVDKSRLPDGSARLVIPDEQGEGAVLRVHGLPQTGKNQVYQVWLRRGDEVVPGSLFEVGSDGGGAAAVADDLRDVDEVMVTRQREGGARAPTEQPVISVGI